ncbi:hypothetical protein HAZT_HAZT008890 [Hyalella azteca]|uniref:C2H2-type domain-containing protein n=1 Tax=Hyalella azteca TaxID=294128 RepID=A0A6A0GV86_HYAAZ|nr:hypothetical protein HAZT_HAZT008890 [Hyalella azteca]
MQRTIHEYLQQKHYQPKQDDEADDDGDVSSDDADLPVLVVNEDGVDMAQNFECPHCQAKLANANLLRRHIEDSHKQMRKHFCTTCDKAFKRKEHLERHLRIHTGIKPFICTICQTKFTQKEHLKGHIDNVHLKKKTALRRNAKIAPAGASLKSLNTSTSEALNVAQESKFLLSNGPRPGAFANGTTTSVNVMGIQNNDSFSRGGKNPLMPRTSESGMEEMNSHGGLLGRMVGSSGVVNSIGGAMNSNLSTALSLLAATASAVAPHLNTTSSSDVHAKDEHHLPSSRDSSPPSLTSPTSLAMSRGTPPHFSTPSFAGSIFPTHSFANIMLPNSSNSTTLFSTLASVSPLNSVFTANLPNTTFSTSTSAAFPSQEDGAIVKELRTNSSPSSRGSGRGRGRGVALARRKTSKLPRISLGRGPELTSPPALSPSPTPTTASSQNNGGPSNLHVAGPHVTPVYSHVTRKSLSSPEKHIKKVVLKYL